MSVTSTVNAVDAATKGSEPIAQVASTALVSLFIPLSISWRNPAILFMHHSPGLFVKRDGQEGTAARASSNTFLKFRLARVAPILKLSRARDWEQSREESATAATTGHICM